MITGRKRFLFQYPGAAVQPVQWVERGQRREAHKVNHPQAVNVYGGLTIYGVTSLHESTGTSKLTTNYKTKEGKRSKNITQEEYRDVLTDTFLKEGQKFFKDHKVTSWTLQQDNDRAHDDAMRTIRSWNRQHNCSIGLIKGWPPNSPDFSHIENLWSLVQRRVDSRGGKTFANFRAAVHEEWARVSPEMARRYMNSLPKRMAEGLEACGKIIKY
jgi:hypothetical protein